MADEITIEFKDEEVQKLLNKLIKRLSKPQKLIRQMERYVHAITLKMFHGRRADTMGVRGVNWEKLTPSTKKQKAALAKRGMAVEINRPLVRTGKMRDSIGVIKKGLKGFVYGTEVRSNSGFPYPGAHQAGGGNLPQRKFIFLNRNDLRQLVRMSIDFIKNREFGYKKYLIK